MKLSPRMQNLLHQKDLNNLRIIAHGKTAINILKFININHITTAILTRKNDKDINKGIYTV